MDNLEPDVSVVMDKDPSVQERAFLFPLVRKIKDDFEKSKRARLSAEQRWLKCYMNYRGLYGREVNFTENERSRAFIKITKVKVLAAYGQIIEVMFANGGLPLAIEPTSLPEGIEENVHVDLDDMQTGPQDANDPFLVDTGGVGFPGDGKDLKPGETSSNRLGNWLTNLLKNAKVKKGLGTKPSSVNFEPALMAAKKMEKKIKDQLEESDGTTHFRLAAFELVLLGTGIIKGPFHYDMEYPKWDHLGNYVPIRKVVPRIEYVSCWDFYPDPEARSSRELNYCVQRHKMTKTMLRDLRKRPYFLEEPIERIVDLGPNWVDEWWEAELDDGHIREDTGRYEVLEYWGVVEDKDLEDLDIDIPDELKDAKEFQVNAWVCGSELLRVVLNPFTPRRIPYHAAPYEMNPYNFFGIGLAENMEDSQTLMNGFTRMAIDNAALSGNMIFEVDETYLVPGQDMKLYPGKIFRRSGGPVGQAVFSHKFNSTVQECLLMFDKFRQLADEQTGLPSYSHGQSGVSSTTRTAAGMSMLMGAAQGNIKTVIKNIDDFLLKPLGEALFAFNMQFDFDPDIKGDLTIKASGTASLMQREVKSQRLLTFLQVTSNPALAPFVKFQPILREIAMAMDIDPDKVVNNPQEAQLQAQLLGMMGAMQGAGGGPEMPQPPGPGMGAGPTGAKPMDPTGAGGGNIGVGQAPLPGEGGFAANTGPKI